MWTAILWVLGISLAVWVFYNAWDRLDYQKRLSEEKGRKRGSGRRRPSPGEGMIQEWLKRHEISFEFDAPVAYSLREPPLRPDFVLADRGVFIEYYGTHQTENEYRQRKQKIYENKGWRVIAVTSDDLGRLESVLEDALKAVESKSA